MDLHFFIYLFVGLILGGVLGFLFFKLYRQQIIKKAQLEAEEIQAEIQEQTELRKLEEQEIIQELETELWTKSEKELLKSEEHISELQEIVDEKKQKVDQRLNELKTQISGKEEAVGTLDKKIRQIEKAFEDKKQNRLQLMKQLSETLCQQLNTTEKEVSKSLQDAWFEEARSEGQKYVERTEEEFKEHAEARAKGILDVALDRFARPYCPERGIGAVFFPDNNIRQIFCDPNKKNIEAVQNACGCDIVIEADSEMVGVAGFDPVRRELTRRTLEKIFREPRWINPTQIQKFAEQLKKDLLKQIRQDGDAIARELKVEQLHPEIKQMMGSLRYRYSFTQNQYFHCSEVGWLCGLLAGELNLNIAQARRSGMLHDIGKSMDHAMDGGHAVIGADFIQTRGEKADVVHAVRAHHFDEQPSTDHAFLVIAADAISGARPGARRSTIESYNQKISELQDIARSFAGVTDCFILSGGRECRVYVNGRKVDDGKAMELSLQIAKRIETECNYPGQIKVVVVRETVAVESTQSHRKEPA